MYCIKHTKREKEINNYKKTDHQFEREKAEGWMGGLKEKEERET